MEELRQLLLDLLHTTGAQVGGEAAAGLTSFNLKGLANGTTQVEVKTYALNNTPEAIAAAVASCRAYYDELNTAYNAPVSPPKK